MSDKKESRDFETASSSKPPSTSATTGSTWSRFKDPRVVRVSRALGGKDRHSKVCTVRGLRDRRVRLSVPTAIQLYDLQERLGLNQPSKVVDWLLNAAKNEIDELPPLQIPQGMFNFTNYQTNNNNNNSYNLDQPMLNFQDFGSSGSHHHHLEDNTNNDDSIFKMDPSSLTLAHTAHPRGGQQEDWHGFGLMPFQQGLVYHHHHQPGIAYLPAGGTSHEVSVVQRSQLSSSPFGSTGQPSDHRQMHDFNLLQPSIQDHNEETET